MLTPSGQLQPYAPHSRQPEECWSATGIYDQLQAACTPGVAGMLPQKTLYLPAPAAVGTAFPGMHQGPYGQPLNSGMPAPA